MTTTMQREPRIVSTDGHTVSVVTSDDAAPQFRWSCTCSPSARGRWVTRRWQAVQGAATHARRRK